MTSSTEKTHSDAEMQALRERDRGIIEKTQAILKKTRARIAEMDVEGKKLKDDLNRDTRRALSLLSDEDRKAIRATDELSNEIKKEDNLLKNEEARWAEQDRQRKK